MIAEPTPLDLDEIARRRIRHDGDVGLSKDDFVILTPAERDALVAAARGREPEEEESHLGPTCDKRGRDHMWAPSAPGHQICLECKIIRPPAPAARVPEMPSDVAGLLKRLKKRHKLGSVSMMDDGDYGLAADAIESLERQRQEAVEKCETLFKDVCVYANRIVDISARAEQAEKELAEARAGSEGRRKVALAKSDELRKTWIRAEAAESVVTAHKTALRSEGTMRQWDGWRRALRETPDASAPRDMFEAWIESICTDIDDALADRKEG